MITNIYFVRHADSSYTPEELNRPLSEKGIKDAKKVTELLSHENITKVISSPYKRAIQTVEGTIIYFNR
jgi:2,3-bisphosphoglycerate-dependent phosphoglycerate mutase